MECQHVEELKGTAPGQEAPHWGSGCGDGRWEKMTRFPRRLEGGTFGVRKKKGKQFKPSRSQGVRRLQKFCAMPPGRGETPGSICVFRRAWTLRITGP